LTLQIESFGRFANLFDQSQELQPFVSIQNIEEALEIGGMRFESCVDELVAFGR
jgi:hypothetical protein